MAKNILRVVSAKNIASTRKGIGPIGFVKSLPKDQEPSIGQPTMNEQLSTTQLDQINGIWECGKWILALGHCVPLPESLKQRRQGENKTSGFVALKLTGWPWEKLLPNDTQQFMWWIRVSYRSLLEALLRSEGDWHLQVPPTRPPRSDSQYMAITFLDCNSTVTKCHKKWKKVDLVLLEHRLGEGEGEGSMVSSAPEDPLTMEIEVTRYVAPNSHAACMNSYREYLVRCINWIHNLCQHQQKRLSQRRRH